MKLKLCIAIFLLASIGLSCKKSVEKAVTRKDLLCSVTWKYAQYYKNYNDTNTVLVYSIWKNYNSKDLSKARIKYNTDGTFIETDETGTKSSGTYKLNSDDTLIELTKNNSTNTIRFGIIDPRNFQWTSLDYNLLGVMLPE